MKYFIIILLFSCNFMTAMKPIILNNFKAYKMGDRIIASAQIEKEKFSVEKNLIDNTLSISCIKQNEDATTYTKGYYYETTENRPKVLLAFEQEITIFQKSISQKPKTKNRSLIRTASRIFTGKN